LSVKGWIGWRVEDLGSRVWLGLRGKGLWFRV
jgi:hypothetical protein